MAMTSQAQRSLLLAFIGSIICFAMAGIYCLLIGHMGTFEGRILGTTAVFGAGSILGMAAAVPWERRRWHPIGPFSLIAIGFAVLLFLNLIWVDRPWRDTEPFARATGIASVIAVALPHIGLLALARLRRSYEWVRLATVALIALLAAQICVSILEEISDEVWYRAMGILAILVVSGTLAVPILHRVSGIRAHEDIQTSSLMISLTCPRCSRPQQLAVGRSRCGNCGLRLSIEIEEEHCSKCGYSLYRLESAVCPECGTPIARPAEAGGRSTHERQERMD